MKITRSHPAKPDNCILQLVGEHNRTLSKALSESARHYPQSLLKHLTAYIKESLKRDDVHVTEIDEAFFRQFESYLAVKLSQRTILTFRRILRRIMTSVGFDGKIAPTFLMREHSRQREYLTADELIQVMKAELPERLSRVRDMFVFSCLTGLRYSTIQELTPYHITEINGSTCLVLPVKLSSAVRIVPLLDIPRRILKKYSSYRRRRCDQRPDLALPVISTVSANLYLNEIVELCGIGKNITFSAGTRTFINTLAYPNNLPVETISYIVGRNLNVCHEPQKTIVADMNELAEKLTAFSNAYTA